MKSCTSCGKELRDEAKFCSSCGQLCSAEVKETAAENPAKPTPKSRKGKIVLLCVLGSVLAIFIAIGALAAWWFTSAEYKILHAVDTENYDQAIAVMKEDESSKNSPLLEKLLKKRILDIKQDFIDRSVEYDVAKKKLAAIRRLKIDGVSEELQTVQAFIESLNASRISFAAAESFYNEEDYGQAIIHYRLVVADDENYATATQKLAEAVEKYRKAVLDKAAQYADTALYAEAVALLKEADQIIPDDAKIQEQIRNYEKRYLEKLKADAMATATEYAKNEDYYNAIKALNSAIEKDATDTQLLAAFNEYAKEYAGQIIRETDAKMEQKDFSGAMSVLREALKLLPENEVLKQKAEEVEAKKPVSITSLLAVNSRWGNWNEGSPTDPFGNDYSTACNYVIHTGYYSLYPYYTEYRLYGKYETLSGVFCTHIDSPEGNVSRLQIYVDDKLVYTSKDFNRKTDATRFTVDVGGAEYIKIVVYPEGVAKAILSDVQLWP